VLAPGETLGLVVLALGCLLALMLRAQELWPFTVDDTFITLQYAKHLAQGLGPVWNPGGPLVEGYTSPLWVLLLALPEALGSSGPLAAKSFSFVLAWLSIVLSAWLAYLATPARRRGARLLAAATPFALGAAYWKLAVHAVSGMETTLTACLLAAFACASVLVRSQPSRLGGSTARLDVRPHDARWLALLALLSALTRPEAALATGTTIVALVVVLERPARARLVKAVLIYAVGPGLVYFVARWSVFGLWFPLPFYVKATGQGSLAGLPHVLAFARDFVLARPAVCVLSIAGAYSARRLLSAPLLGAVACALFFLHPKHIMGFEGRYLVPLVPLLFAACGVGLVGVLSWLDAALSRSLSARMPNEGLLRLLQRACVPAAWLLLLASACSPFPSGYASAARTWRAYGEGMARAHIALADELQKHAEEQPRPVIAMLDVGAVAYLSDWIVVDTYGLNDARVALSRRTDLGYVFAQQPELLVLVSELPDRFVPVFDWELPLARVATARGYTPVRSYPFEMDYHLQVWARPGSRFREALASARPMRAAGLLAPPATR
jgi:arabinofuranosyltransferase